MLYQEKTMKKIVISVFGISAVGFITTCGPNFTKAVAQTVTPERTGCGTQLTCDPGGKPYTGEISGKYYIMGIPQNKESYEYYLRSTISPVDDLVGEPLDSSLNQSLDEPLDTSLNQSLDETQVTDSPTQDDGSLTVDPNAL